MKLESLSLIQLLEIRHNGYKYLVNSKSVNSYTQETIKNIANDDSQVLINCFIKTLEELEESELAIVGKHKHDNQTQRETIINEIQQSIYWPTIICVSNGDDFKKIDYIKYLELGLNNLEITKEQLKENLEKTDSKAIILLRKILVIAGQNITKYNYIKKENLELKEIILQDILQMTAKEYFNKYFEEIGDKI